jgi:adenylate kinase
MSSSHVIFIGAPGSGKGTQSSKLVKEFSFKHISTGNLLREEMSKKSEIGLKAQDFMAKGLLVPDSIVGELLTNLDLDNGSYIFDGYPRNIAQAEFLADKVLGSRDYKVIYFELKVDELVDRLAVRRICENCGEIYNLIHKPLKQEGICDVCGSTKIIHRKDDTAEVIKDRMQIFASETQAVLDYFEGKKKLVKINALGSIEDIFEQIKQVIK